MTGKERCSCRNNSAKPKHAAGLVRTLCHALSQLCWIFCCPPCPPCIIRKIAFHPPRPATYRVLNSGGGGGSARLELVDECLKVMPAPQMPGEVVLLQEHSQSCVCREPKKLVVMQWLHPPATSRSNLLILHSHVNAADLGSVQIPMEILAKRTGCDVVAYDYSGYGGSEGTPSEDSILRNADTVMHYVIDGLHRSPSDIIVYGQSIGSVPTWYLASKYRVAGVIQLSGLYSGWRTLSRDARSTTPDSLSQPTSGCCCLNPFNNAGLVKDVRAPILLIHGRADEVIQFSQALELFSLCGGYAVQPLWIDGVGHVGIERTREFYERVNKFVHEEVRPAKGRQASPVAAASRARSSASPLATVNISNATQPPRSGNAATTLKSRIIQNGSSPCRKNP